MDEVFTVLKPFTWPPFGPLSELDSAAALAQLLASCTATHR